MLERRHQQVRFEYCVDHGGRIKYLRALQGHSGGVRVDPTLQNHVQIPYGWTDHIYHVGSTKARRSIVDAGFLAGGTVTTREDAHASLQQSAYCANSTTINHFRVESLVWSHR